MHLRIPRRSIAQFTRVQDRIAEQLRASGLEPKGSDILCAIIAVADAATGGTGIIHAAGAPYEAPTDTPEGDPQVLLRQATKLIELAAKLAAPAAEIPEDSKYEAPPPELDRPPQVMDAIIDSLRAARGNAADCEALLLKHFPDLEAKAKAEGD